MFGNFALESFYLFGSFQGIIIVILLTIKRRTKANNLLAILIALLSLFLFEQVMYLNSGIRKYPHILYSTLPVTFLVGPVIYHFVRLNTTSDQTWKWNHLIHLVPFAYELAILAPFYILPADIKISIYEYTLQPSGTKSFNQYSFGYLIYITSTLYFLSLSFRLLNRVNSQHKKEQKKRKLLLQVTMTMAIYLAINLILFIVTFFQPDFKTNVLQVSPLLLSILIHLIGLICFLNPDALTSGTKSIKYVNSGLSQQEVEKLGQSLVSALEEKSLFLNQELKPGELAKELGISTTDLSRVISEGLNTNFYNLINEHRVNKAKALLTSEHYADAKLVHIGLDSGFSNKSSFVRNFKRFTGMNPSDFRKKEHHSSEWNA